METVTYICGHYSGGQSFQVRFHGNLTIHALGIRKIVNTEELICKNNCFMAKLEQINSKSKRSRKEAKSIWGILGEVLGF